MRTFTAARKGGVNAESTTHPNEEAISEDLSNPMQNKQKKTRPCRSYPGDGGRPANATNNTGTDDSPQEMGPKSHATIYVSHREARHGRFLSLHLKCQTQNNAHQWLRMDYRMDVARVTKGSHRGQLLRTQTKL
ncbi:hypothetical protein AVEN_273421-1 [Araneus ventricosus]|uniref:Uncharacterized protein n=1 Tax=Araneus ventricosus TaxID=182803 RepID=A0A4Y2DZB5_ARAVE|nr:hypothetical protein AVEN_273421-1 [Araneus ventricosus]